MRTPWRRVFSAREVNLLCRLCRCARLPSVPLLAAARVGTANSSSYKKLNVPEPAQRTVRALRSRASNGHISVHECPYDPNAHSALVAISGTFEWGHFSRSSDTRPAECGVPPRAVALHCLLSAAPASRSYAPKCFVFSRRTRSAPNEVGHRLAIGYRCTIAFAGLTLSAFF